MSVNEKAVIVKSNMLIEASYRLTLSEQKIILMLASSINKDDVDFKSYKFKVSDFVNLLGTSSQKWYTELKEITKGLMQKVFEIWIDNKKILASWLSSVTYYEGEGVIELRFDPWLKEFLLQLKSKYTKYMLRNVVQMRSAYSIRIYELLKQYESIGYREFEVSKLRYILGIAPDQYPKYANFKQRVIKQAQKELAELADISFDIKEIKINKKVEKIYFIIKSNNPNAIKNLLHINKEDVEHIWNVVRDAGGVDVNKGWIEEQLNYIVNKLKVSDPMGYFLEKIEVLKQQSEIKTSVEAVLAWAIKNDVKPGTKKAQVAVPVSNHHADEKKRRLMAAMYGKEARSWNWANRKYIFTRNKYKAYRKALQIS